jgi:hypothetical protein
MITKIIITSKYMVDVYTKGGGIYSVKNLKSACGYKTQVNEGLDSIDILWAKGTPRERRAYYKVIKPSNYPEKLIGDGLLYYFAGDIWEETKSILLGSGR